MPKNSSPEHSKNQAEKTAKKYDKNARSSHGLDAFFKHSSESRDSKRRDLIQASREATGDRATVSKF